MEQLILHLFGDYVTQSNWMAQNKTKSWFPAIAHAVIYGIPFLWLTPSFLAFAVIVVSHAIIDHYRLARYVVFAKNWINDISLRWEDNKVTGYPSDTPPWLAFWLLIIADNTMHLAINYAALRWL
jgi:hypothetical protein